VLYGRQVAWNMAGWDASINIARSLSTLPQPCSNSLSCSLSPFVSRFVSPFASSFVSLPFPRWSLTSFLFCLFFLPLAFIIRWIGMNSVSGLRVPVLTSPRCILNFWRWMDSYAAGRNRDWAYLPTALCKHASYSSSGPRLVSYGYWWAESS
jgi:hypothetical protein